MAMNNDSFSVTQGIFLIENAFFENELSYEKFLKAIQKKVNLCREIIRSEKLNPNDNLAKNYAMQRLFSGGARIYHKPTKTWQPVKPFQIVFWIWQKVMKENLETILTASLSNAAISR